MKRTPAITAVPHSKSTSTVLPAIITTGRLSARAISSAHSIPFSEDADVPGQCDHVLAGWLEVERAKFKMEV
jgi:hypothetical protein